MRSPAGPPRCGSPRETRGSATCSSRSSRPTPTCAAPSPPTPSRAAASSRRCSSAARRPPESPVARAEQALAFALAHRGERFDDRLFQRLLRDRGDGGSWGVVAALNDVPASAVDAYALSLAPAPDAAPAQAAGEPAAPDVLGPLVGLPPVAVPGGGPSAAPSPRSSPRPSPRPSASPAPGPGGTDPLPPVVRDVVDAVLDVLPVEPPLLGRPAAPASTSTPTRAPLLDVELDLPLLR